MDRNERVQEFLQQFSTWVKAQAQISTAALVGSYARGTARADSDVDLVILSANAWHFLDDTAWAALFGEVMGQQAEEYGVLTSLRVWYRDGLEVEFGWAGLEWAGVPIDAGTRRVVSDGIRVLYERLPIFSPLIELVNQ